MIKGLFFFTLESTEIKEGSQFQRLEFKEICVCKSFFSEEHPPRCQRSFYSFYWGDICPYTISGKDSFATVEQTPVMWLETTINYLYYPQVFINKQQLDGLQSECLYNIQQLNCRQYCFLLFFYNQCY